MDLTTFQPVLDALLTVAMTFVVAISPILVKAGIGYLETRLRVDLNEKQEQAVHDLINRGIHYAEESARKHLISGEKRKDGNAKMEKALAFIAAEADRMGLQRLVNVQAEHLADMVESKLSLKRHSPENLAKPTPPVLIDSKRVAALEEV